MGGRLNINTTTLTWSNAVSGTAGNNISFSERMRITSDVEVVAYFQAPPAT